MVKDVRILSVVFFFLGSCVILTLIPNASALANFYTTVFSEISRGELGIIGFGIVTFVSLGILMAVFSLVTAILLWTKNAWARPIGLFVCILLLFFFPIGTVLAIYGIVHLRNYPLSPIVQR